MSQRVDELTGDGKRKLVLRISIEPLIRLLPGLFYIANLIRMMSFSTMPYMVFLYVVGGIGLLTLFFVKQYNRKTCLLFLFLYLLSLTLNYFFVGNVSISNIGVNALFFGIAYMMLIHQWSIKEGAFVFYCTAVILLIRMGRGSFLRMLVSSSNYISILLLLSVSFYYIALEYEKKKMKAIDLLPALLCFLMCVWARGRGGILSATVLFLLVLLIFMRTITHKNTKRILILFFIVVLIGAIYSMVDYSLLDTFMGLGKWSTRGADISDRILIWGSYVSATSDSFVNLFLGAPFEEAYYVNRMGGNCHNSFLQLHAYGGLLIFIIYIFMMVRAFRYFLKNKQYIMASMMFVIFLRGLSDKFIFGQYGMPVMLYFVLQPFLLKEKYSEAAINSVEQTFM